MIEYRNLRVALLGGGTVGAQVARLLLEQADEMAGRVLTPPLYSHMTTGQACSVARVVTALHLRARDVRRALV